MERLKFLCLLMKEVTEACYTDFHGRKASNGFIFKILFMELKKS